MMARGLLDLKLCLGIISYTIYSTPHSSSLFIHVDVNFIYISLYKYRCNMAARVAAIEKWTAVADICRCLHNFNGVLQICAAFTSAPIFRMKKTWDKVPKNVRLSHF